MGPRDARLTGLRAPSLRQHQPPRPPEPAALPNETPSPGAPHHTPVKSASTGLTKLQWQDVRGARQLGLGYRVWRAGQVDRQTDG